MSVMVRENGGDGEEEWGDGEGEWGVMVRE